MKEPPNPSILRQRLEGRRISVYAVAARLGKHPGHLARVLHGERPGSAALLQSVEQITESMLDQPRRHRQEDIVRLIDAAVHVFFLKRGKFQSPICAPRRRGLEIED